MRQRPLQGQTPVAEAGAGARMPPQISLDSLLQQVSKSTNSYLTN